MFAVFRMGSGPKAGVKSRVRKHEERCAALVGDQNRDGRADGRRLHWLGLSSTNLRRYLHHMKALDERGIAAFVVVRLAVICGPRRNLSRSILDMQSASRFLRPGRA
jgi:hypothetical protein